MKTYFYAFIQFSALVMLLGQSNSIHKALAAFSVKKNTTKYYFIWHNYNGTWSNSRTSSQKMLFITDVETFDFETYTECSLTMSRAEKAFVNTLGQIYETKSNGKISEDFSGENRALDYRNRRIEFYQRMGYELKGI